MCSFVLFVWLASALSYPSVVPQPYLRALNDRNVNKNMLTNNRFLIDNYKGAGITTGRLR